MKIERRNQQENSGQRSRFKKLNKSLSPAEARFLELYGKVPTPQELRQVAGRIITMV